MYDIAIIGLGPAGATLARLLDKKYKVLVVDRKKSGAYKCCGGLLSPDAQKILAGFDIALPKNVLANPQIFSVKTIDLDNGLERFYQRFYLNMDRARFDNFLVSLIPGNVEIRGNSICTKVKKETGAYHLEIKTNGTLRTERAKIIIGVDGANSVVRNTFYKKNRIHKYIAVQEWYRNNINSPFYSCIFNRRITDSYCWTMSKDEHFIIGGAFPSADAKARFAALKKHVQNSGFSFGELVKREACFVYINKGFAGTCTGTDGAYLAGEAAGMISPSSLEGISYAMKSAKILAECINKKGVRIGYIYFTGTLGIRIKLLFKQFKMPFMYNTLLRKLVMKSGISAIKK